MANMSKASRSSMENGDVQQQGSVPVPDPTKLTTDAVEKATESIEKTMDAKQLLQDTRIDALRGRIEARLDEQEKAVVLLRTTTDKVPDIIKNMIEGLRVLHQEKFDSVSTQFKERDTRTEQKDRDTKGAVDVAFSSQAKAIEKAEAGFTKQIDGISVQISTMAKTLDDKIAAVKDLYGSLSGIQTGAHQLMTGKEEGSKAVWIAIGGVIGALVGIIPVIVMLISAINKP